MTLNLKSLVKVVALFIMMTTAGTELFATEVPSGIIVKQAKDKSFALYMDFQSEKHFKITLKDVDATTLFKESVKRTKTFVRQFDLKNLPDGTYFLEVEDDQSIFTQTINIHGGILHIDKNEEEKVFKPVVYLKEKRVYLSTLVLDGSDTEISISNDNGEVVYTETVKGQVNIEKVFSFLGQNPEDYNMTVRFSDHEFVFTQFLSLHSFGSKSK